MSAEPQRANEPLPSNAALTYADLGWHVFPLHTPDTEGRCSCRRDCGRDGGKHPRVTNGLKDATTDPGRIDRWWGMWPTANVGLRTGEVSGMFALDVDPRKGGREGLAALERKHGPLPITVTARTGSGGDHFIFAYPGSRVSNKADVAEGVDIRGDGGYIVGVPSQHKSGGVYTWAPGRSPFERDPAPLPQAWIDLLAPERPDYSSEHEAGEWRGFSNGTRPPFGPIIDGCPFLQHARDDAETLPEDQWHSAVSIVALCQDGERLSHELSAPYPDYRYEETQKKCERALAEDKPHSCGTIRYERGGEPFCSQCLNWGKIKSPIQLGAARINRGASNGRHDAEDGENGRASADDKRPTIDAGDQDLERISAKAWTALTRANDPPRLFRFGGVPVRIEGGDGDVVPIAQALSEDRLGHELARSAAWYKLNEKGVEKSASPPMRMIRDMLAAPSYPLPSLLSIVQTPVFAPDGSLHTDPGYHPAGRTFYAPAPNFAVPPVPERPTTAEVARARDLIIDDLLGEFPFVDDAERANAVALFLDPYVRNLIDGPTPLRLIEAPTPGSGKGLLADVVLRPAVGRRVAVMPAANDDDEWRKRITAQLCLMPSAILIDNVVKALDSGSLSSALTATWWTDRRLGAHEMVNVPVRCVWLGTANNPTMSTELARRTVRIRLDPQMDRPWQRTGFKHDDLRTWADDNRAELVWSALVLGRAWIAEGAPVSSTTLGSFERWGAVLGGILGTAGVDGFLGNLDTFYETADLEGAIWRQFVALWFEQYGESEVGVADLFGLALTVDGFDFGKGNERAQKISFGMSLNQHRDRVIGEFRIVHTRTVKRIKRWRLIRARSGDNPFAAFYTHDASAAAGGSAGDDSFTG